MVNSDLRVLVMRMRMEGEDIWTRFVGGAPSDGEDLCEMFCNEFGEVPKGMPVYSTQVYRDAKLTVRELETGGADTICEECLVEQIVSSYISGLSRYSGEYWSEFVEEIAWSVDPDALIDRTKTTTGGS